MAVFAFYNFQLTKIGKPTEINFPDIAPRPITSNQQELFSSLFIEEQSADIHTLIPKSDGSYDDEHRVTYGNDVLANYNDIIVLNIENNKKKTTIVDKQKINHQHNPYCYVIIDYRPEQCLLAVQKSSAFDSQPDKLKDILSQALNLLFFNYGYTITFTPLVQKNISFWNAINEIRTQNNDSVKKVCLDFHSSDKGKKNKYNSGDLAATLAALSDKAEANGVVVLEADEGRAVNVDAIEEDLVQLADICYTQQEYDLTVYFGSYGIYRYGADLIAQFGIEDKIIEQYTAHVDQLDMFDSTRNLPNWLSQTKDILMRKYVNADTPTIPAKQGRRK